jgi:hypothetical protein
MKMGSHHLYDDIERLETRDSPLKDEEFNWVLWEVRSLSNKPFIYIKLFKYV